MSLQNILINKNIRDNILKYKWPRKLSILKDRVKFIKKPYLIEDIHLAIKHNSINCLEVFLKNINPDITICNQANTFKIFKTLWDHHLKTYTKDEILKRLEPDEFISKDDLDIIDFLYNQGRIKAIDVIKINSPKIYEYLLEKKIVDKDNLYKNMFGDELIIYLIGNGEIEYCLGDAIDECRLDVIDYYIENSTEMDCGDICDLIEMGYDNIENIPFIHNNYEEIAYKAIITGNHLILDKMIEGGFDKDIMIDCAKEIGYYDVEEFLYNY